HRDDPCREIRAERVPREQRDTERAPEQDPVQAEHDEGAREAELFADDREDEVGVLLGDEVEVRLRSLPETDAGQPAGPDRDLGLLAIVERVRAHARGAPPGNPPTTGAPAVSASTAG